MCDMTKLWAHRPTSRGKPLVGSEFLGGTAPLKPDPLLR